MAQNSRRKPRAQMRVRRSQAAFPKGATHAFLTPPARGAPWIALRNVRQFLPKLMQTAFPLSLHLSRVQTILHAKPQPELSPARRKEMLEWISAHGPRKKWVSRPKAKNEFPIEWKVGRAAFRANLHEKSVFDPRAWPKKLINVTVTAGNREIEAYYTVEGVLFAMDVATGTPNMPGRMLVRVH